MEERPIGVGDGSALAPVVMPDSCISVIEQQARAEIDIQISTAKRFPRSISAFKARLKDAVRSDKTTAQSCFYTVPRDGKRITGPSVRLGELAASCYQNCRYGGRVIDIGDKYITAQGIFHDLENNVFVSVEVKRRITHRDGTRFSDDMVGTAANATVAIAKRNAIIGGIPRPLLQESYDLARQVAVGDAKDLKSAIAGALAKALSLNISSEAAFAYLQVGGEAEITTGHLLDLVGAINAVESGEATVAETFPTPEGGKTEGPGRRTFGRKKVEPPAAGNKDGTGPGQAEKSASGVVSAPDPNRPSQMSAPQSSIFWRKAEEVSGTRSKAVVAVQLAIDALVKEQTISTDVKGWQDVSDKDSEFVLAALERLAKKE
jgi:hypothetical protein